MNDPAHPEESKGHPEESEGHSEALEGLRAVIHGRVQGVGFRDFVDRRARFLGLTGYVRNMPDGRSVEVVAEGAREALEQLAEYLRQGPRSAEVRSVDASWHEATGRYGDFGVGL